MKAAFAAAAIAVLGAVASTGISAAQAEPNCNGFFNNPDGSWTPTHIIVVGSPTSQTQVGPGDRLIAGTPGVKGRLGNYLDTHCRLGGNAVRPIGIPRVP
jgi:hypothetical protein